MEGVSAFRRNFNICHYTHAHKITRYDLCFRRLFSILLLYVRLYILRLGAPFVSVSVVVIFELYFALQNDVFDYILR